MIEIRNLTSCRIPPSFLANARRLFLLHKIPKTVEVSVVFVTPTFMRNLNRRYRKQDRPTNVLSFGSSPRERRSILRSGQGMLGEIFICPKLIAGHQQRSPEFIEGLTRLLVHAILHLKGNTHARGRDSRVMERKEIEIIGKLSMHSAKGAARKP